MLESPVVGILHRVPDGHHVGVQMYIGLSSEGRVPQVGIAVTIGAGGTANHIPMIFRHKQSSVAARHHLPEEDVVGDIALRLQDVVVSQQFRESLKVLFCRNHFRCHTLGMGYVDTSLQLFRDALFGSMAVQRVVDAHPVHRVEPQLSQLLVAQHFLTQVTHLNI